MALINKNDFSIVTHNQDYRTQNDYFECDDLIAPAISLLNKKGYKTKFCCSGHPFSRIDIEVREELSPEDLEPTPEYEVLWSEDSDFVPDDYILEVDTDEYPFCVICKYNFCDMFYVVFEEKYEFPELPGDIFIIDDNELYEELGRSISCDYENNYPTPTENFDAMMRIFEINKIFYEWVEKLPNLERKDK